MRIKSFPCPFYKKPLALPLPGRGWALAASCFGTELSVPTLPVTVPCCPSRAMAKAPTTASTGSCHPTTASPRHRSWELDSWVSACSCLPGPQGRARVALAGPCWGERWDSLAAPCAGAAPGVLQAVVQGGGVQRVPSVPAVPAVLCVWLFPCFMVASQSSSRDRCPPGWAECAPGSWESGAGEMLIVKGFIKDLG